MKFVENAQLGSANHNRPVVFDIAYTENQQPKPIIIFVHGFKGFKDWGPFPLMSDYFAKQGYVFLKLNLSHNGTTPAGPLDFGDLTAFGENTYLIELNDLSSVIDHVFEESFPVPASELDRSRLFMIGHSRGGGVVIIKAANEKRLSGIATWASVDSLAPRLPAPELTKWKEEGVRFIYNGRTKQNMPMQYRFYETYMQHEEMLNIEKAVKGLDVPYIAFHGADDETLPPAMLDNLGNWNSSILTRLVPGANHTFGGHHPYEASALPEKLQYVCDETNNFFKTLLL